MTDAEMKQWIAVTENSRYQWTEDEITRLNGRGALYYLGGKDGIYSRIDPEGKLSAGTYEGALPHIGEAFFTRRAVIDCGDFNQAFQKAVELGGQQFLQDMFSTKPAQILHVQVELWLHEYKLNALASVLEEEGLTVEQRMQDALTELYVARVPPETRQDISTRIKEEPAAREVEIEALRCGNRRTGDDVTDESKSTPPHDDDCLRNALIKMMFIRGGGRFRVVTYSEDDGGADEKLDYASVTGASRAARGYVCGESGLVYDGALVYDKVERRIVRQFGSFPEYALPK